MPNQFHELGARLRIRLERASHGARDREAVLLLNPSHHHAKMLGLDDDSDTLRLKDVFDGLRDIHSQALLHLKSASKNLDRAGDLGQADDLAIRDVAHMDSPEEGHHMVLTLAEKVDVFDKHHFVVVDVKKRARKDFSGILFVALGKKPHSFCHAAWGLEQAVSARVFSEFLNDALYIPFDRIWRIAGRTHLGLRLHLHS